MNQIERFIRSVLDSRGINEQDKKELEIELKDHLNSLKLDYIKRGYSEQEAIALCIKEFGNPNALGNDLKRYLVSQNKGNTLTASNKVNGILLMGVIYFCTTLFYAIVINDTLTGLYYPIVTITTIGGIYLYINMKLYDKLAKIRSFPFFLISFFLIERLLLFFISSFSIYLRGGNWEWVSVLNLAYILFYTLFSSLALLLLKINTKGPFGRIKNPYNSQVKLGILVVISLGLSTVYYLFPNRCYPLFVLIEKLLGKPINEVDRKILYMIINNEYILPNLGLLMFVGVLLVIVYKILSKGIRSIV